MVVHKLYKDEIFFAFELDCIYVSLKKIEELLNQVDSVSEVKGRKLFSQETEDEHLSFKYKDHEFIVWEPFGDNSRYWIGPRDEKGVISVDDIALKFIYYSPPFFIELFGRVLTFDFKAWPRYD